MQRRPDLESRGCNRGDFCIELTYDATTIDPARARSSTLLTIPDTNLVPHAQLFHQELLRAGRVNFLLQGILYADGVSTVSPRYAKEIQTELSRLSAASAGSASGDAASQSCSSVGTCRWYMRSWVSAAGIAIARTHNRVDIETGQGHALHQEAKLRRPTAATGDLDEASRRGGRSSSRNSFGH